MFIWNSTVFNIINVFKENINIGVITDGEMSCCQPIFFRAYFRVKEIAVVVYLSAAVADIILRVLVNMAKRRDDLPFRDHFAANKAYFITGIAVLCARGSNIIDYRDDVMVTAIITTITNTVSVFINMTKRLVYIKTSTYSRPPRRFKIFSQISIRNIVFAYCNKNIISIFGLINIAFILNITGIFRNRHIPICAFVQRRIVFANQDLLPVRFGYRWVEINRFEIKSCLTIGYIFFAVTCL